MAIEVACGTVAGSRHKKNGIPNQDAISVSTCNDVTVGVICDGCSSSPHSDFGAKLGAKLAVEDLSICLGTWSGSWFTANEQEFYLEFVRGHILEDLRSSIRGLRYNHDDVMESLLFTMVCVVMSPKFSMVLSIGDGVFKTGEDPPTVIGPFPGNAPPYLSYSLIDYQVPRDWLKFRLNHYCLGDEIRNIWIGSDGVSDLIKLSNDSIPGRSEKIGDVDQFLSDKYFENPFLLGGRLRHINRETVEVEDGIGRINWGVLPDDTSLIVLRRKV